MLPAERSGRANLLLWIYFHQDGWLPSFPPLQWLIAAGGVRILALLKRLRPEKDFGRSPCFSPDTGPDIFFLLPWHSRLQWYLALSSTLYHAQYRILLVFYRTGQCW